MTPIPLWHGTVADGRLSLDPSEARDRARWLRGLSGPVEVIVRRRRERRSLDQNAYWWAVPVALVAAETGYTPEQAHYALLGEYGGYQEGIGGHQVPRLASSAALTRAEFSRMIEWVLDWAPSALGVDVPSPDEAT